MFGQHKELQCPSTTELLTGGGHSSLRQRKLFLRIAGNGRVTVMMAPQKLPYETISKGICEAQHLVELGIYK